MTNRETFEELFQTNGIDIRRSGLFDLDPAPLPRDFDFDRIEGMMLGLTVGDALGITTEVMIPRDRHRHYGEIRDCLPNRYVQPGPGEGSTGATRDRYHDS
jgi:hypothetical protein